MQIVLQKLGDIMKKTYIVMIVIGTIATLLSIVTIWTDPVMGVILNIVAMLGSGVLCSTIVSFFINQQIDLISLQNKLDSERFLFSRLIDKICFLVSIENKYLSILIWNNRVFKKDETTCSLEAGTNKVLSLLSEIQANFNDLNDVKRLRGNQANKTHLRNYLCDFTLQYYKDLNQNILSIVTNGAFYLKSRLLNEKFLNQLVGIERTISLIDLISSGDSVDRIIEQKITFFRKILDCFGSEVNFKAVEVYMID